MTVIIGVVLAANALLVALALSVGRQLFVNQLAGTVFGPASTVFYDRLLSYLERGQQVLLWLGLILVVVGWFAGRNQHRSRRPGGRRGRPGDGRAPRSPTVRSPVPAGGSRPTPAGCGSSSVFSAWSSCCGATTSRCPGCSGRWCSWACSWRSSRSWSGQQASRTAPAPQPHRSAPSPHPAGHRDVLTFSSSHPVLQLPVPPVWHC